MQSRFFRRLFYYDLKHIRKKKFQATNKYEIFKYLDIDQHNNERESLGQQTQHGGHQYSILNTRAVVLLKEKVILHWFSKPHRFYMNLPLTFDYIKKAIHLHDTNMTMMHTKNIKATHLINLSCKVCIKYTPFVYCLTACHLQYTAAPHVQPATLFFSLNKITAMTTLLFNENIHLVWSLHIYMLLYEIRTFLGS